MPPHTSNAKNSSASVAELQERIAGALLGLACGDALGAPAEFKSQAEVRERWGTLTEMVGGGLWLPGEWTDDTGMALCIAEGILTQPADPIAEAGNRFLEWKKTAKDVGSTIAAALSGFDGDWPAAARNTPQAKQGKAAGNGSLMRTLPVALAYSDRKTMLIQSARFSAMTHWDPQAELCCAIYCLWVGELLQGGGLRESWQSALKQGAELNHGARLSADTVGPKPLPAGFWERLKTVESESYEELQPTGYAGYVVDCLEAAAWCCLKSESLEEALVQAVNLAGEADTIAAVAGGVAGAHWGRAAVPERWLEKLNRREYLESIAEALVRLRRHLVVYATEGLPALNYDRISDRVYAGRNPLSGRDVEVIAAAGVTLIVDLREPREWAAPKYGTEALEEIERRGIRRVHLPVTDMGAPTPDDFERFCQIMDAALADPGVTVYVHCRAGMERTAALLIADHARRNGLSYLEASEQLRLKRPRFEPLPTQRAAVKKWLETQRRGNDAEIREMHRAEISAWQVIPVGGTVAVPLADVPAEQAKIAAVIARRSSIAPDSSAEDGA